MGWTKVDPIRVPKLSDASILRAIDDTTAAAAISAKSNHGWHNRTGAAESSIRFEPARKVGPSLFRGLFGSFAVDYFIFLELGTRYMRADHTLRRAADAEFPSIARRLRAS